MAGDQTRRSRRQSAWCPRASAARSMGVRRRLHHVLAVLRVLRIGRRRGSRFHKLVAQLHVERDVARHIPGRVADNTIEGRVISEVTDVITRHDEVEVSPFPFPTEKSLVPGNRTRGERERAIVIISQEAVEGSRARLRLQVKKWFQPPEKVNLPKRSVGSS